MIRFLCALVLCLIPAVALSSDIQERVPFQNVPELAAGKWYVTVIYNDPMQPADVKLYEFLRNDRSMQSLRPQVVWNEYTTSRSIVKSTAWKTYLGGDQAEFPAILMQGASDQEGQATVIFFGRGKQLVESLKRLPEDIQAAITKHTETKQQRPCPPGQRCPLFPRRPRPEPQPQPEPAPAPAPVTPPPAVTPIVPTVTTPEAPAEEEGGLPLLALLIPLAAAGLGIWKSFPHS